MRHSLIIVLIATLSILSCTNDSPKDNATVQNNAEQINSDSLTAGVDEINTEKRTATEKDYAEYYPSGNIKIEGDYNADGERDALWVSYYEDGTKWSESYYVKGLKNGHSVTFFPNGKVRYVGEYKDDKQVGPWTFYDENGDVAEEKEF